MVEQRANRQRHGGQTGSQQRLARWRSESGQTVAMVLPMLFALVLFVSMVANIGQAVNRRIALQLVADAGAYTGASAMATGMNHLAYWNRQVQRMYVSASDVSFGFNFSPSCVLSVAAIGSYGLAYGFLMATYDNFSTPWADGGLPQKEARRVSSYNISDLFPGEEVNDFSFSEEPSADGLFPGRLPLPGFVPVLPVTNGATAVPDDHDWEGETGFEHIPNTGDDDEEWEGFTQDWYCWVEGTIAPPRFQDLTMPTPPWLRIFPNAGVRPWMFSWEITAPATKALMFDNFFGPNAIPEMKAVAAAQPVGGDIEEGLSRYRTRLVPVSRLSLTYPLPFEIDDPLFGPRRVTH